ncbi:hypothetical protein [Pontibacillus marinus]|uniref:Uncharacterized protein n=1 Tax=Pontibacillus marinus BH030004 = DSM 16465 TaxID=1385511 RepID=A0A0A5G4S6_9BACI|nr:hypothetical protein [Pontibacillus marinus]KGX86158.1 hypothetical protein N783_12620 [Pontibacillus marinus BH030004 = DSM 16465]
MKVLQNRKQLGILIFVLIAIVLFYLFSSQSISTLKEEEEPSEPQDFSNKPYDIFFTHSTFQKQHERWSVQAEGYQFIRFSEEGQEEYKTGKLTIEYKGDRLPEGPFTAKVETLSGSVTHNYDDQPLDERKITFFSLDHLGHRGSTKPVTVTLEWKDNKDVLKLEGSVQSFHEHHIKEPISLDKVEAPELEEIFNSEKKHKTVVENGELKMKISSVLLLSTPFRNDEKKTPMTLNLPTDSMTIPFSFQVDNVNEGKEVSIFYRNEFGNIIEIWNKGVEPEDLKNDSLFVNQSVPFKHFGRKQIWAEVDGKVVGKIGLSLRPKIPSE